MQTFDIEPNKTFVASRTRGTRRAVIKQDVGASADYPEGLLLAVDSDGKLFPSDESHIAVCALIAPIAKLDIVAGDVETSVVYLVGVGKPCVSESNPDLRITEAYITEAEKNGLDIKKISPDKEVYPVSMAITGSWANTQYTEQPVDPTGLTFKVTYSDNGVETVVPTFSPETWGDTAGEQTATFSYTEAGITVSAEKEATVVLDVPSSLAITGTLTNAQTVSTAPDITGLTATATYLSGKTANVTADVTVSPALYGETAGTETLTLSYTEGGATVSDSMEVTVTE